MPAVLVFCPQCRRVTEDMPGAAVPRAYCAPCDLVVELDALADDQAPSTPPARRRRSRGKPKREMRLPPQPQSTPTDDPWARRKDLE